MEVLDHYKVDFMNVFFGLAKVASKDIVVDSFALRVFYTCHLELSVTVIRICVSYRTGLLCSFCIALDEDALSIFMKKVQLKFICIWLILNHIKISVH